MKTAVSENHSIVNILEDLYKINDQDIFDKKVKSIFSWMEWQRKKNVISISEYQSLKKKIDTLRKDKFYSNNKNKDNFESKNTTINFNLLNYKFISAIFILFLLIFNIYIYNLYRSLSSQITNRQTEGRVIPFKGIIKSTDGKPLDTKRDVVFNLYPAAKNGLPIYTGKCIGESGLQPNYNGAFNILLGSDCGMKPIPDYIFQENSTLYLGMKVGSDIELNPRYQIFTTSYSKDTSQLNGLGIGTKSGSIPYIDQSGMIQITADSPLIKSTNGTFSIESQEISLKAEDTSNGNILLQPGAESNVIIPFGHLGIGTYKPDSILDVAATQLFTSTASIKNLANQDDENTSTLKLSLGTPQTGVKSNFVEFYAGTTTDDPGVKVGDIRLNKNAVVYETSGADFAEYFTLPAGKQIPSVGSIISLSSKGIHEAVPNEKIIGVVSSTAGFIGNKKEPSSTSVLIGLAGQVKVYVSTINGEIEVGDRLGASLIPGYTGVVSEIDKSAGYVLEKKSEEQFTNEQCPNSYKNKRDPSGRKVRCGMVKIILSLD